jgi:type I restriction enzyme, S subunit
MTDRNANLPGYKKTRVGWIPEEWRVERIGDVSKSFSGGTPSRSVDEYFSGNIPWIKSGELNRGFISNTEEKITAEGLKNSSAKLVNANTLLYALYGATAGVPAITKIEAAFNQAVLALFPDPNLANDYLYYWLQKAKDKLVCKYTQGGQPNFSGTLVRSFFIPIPPYEEQKKIAEILSTWDQAIEQTRALIAAKQRMKKGLMQQLLTGRMRFPGFGPAVDKKGDLPEGWKERKLGYFLQKKLRKEKKPDHPFTKLGIRSHGKGIFTTEIEDPNQYSMKYFYRVKEDDIIVNITFAWEGAIAHVNKEGHNTLVSHRFPTYKANNKKMCVHYLKYLIHTNRFFYDLETISPGGAGRNRVMRKSDFLKINVIFPILKEQEKIANTLDSLDSQINQLETLKCKYIKQKQGCMQKLLIGEVRV